VAAVAGVGWAPQPQAVLWAAAEAELRRVPLLLVHGYGTLPYESGLAEHELLGQAARAELDDAVASVARAHPGVAVRALLDPQRPDLVLRERSMDAAVVVIGTKTHAAATVEARFGSVAGALLGSARCPVVAVPPAGVRAQAVVVAVDGTLVSQRAVAFAFDAASRRRARLRVVHCWTGSAAGHEHRMLLAEALAGFAERYPDVEVVDDGCEGHPGTELVRLSRGAALLVVGSHGRDRWATTVWGSVSRTLARQSACPVAVVRAGGPWDVSGPLPGSAWAADYGIAARS